MEAITLELGKSELCEFGGVSGVFLLALIIESELFAGVDAVDRVGNDFVPQGGGTLVIAAALRHLGKLAASAGMDVTGQAEIDGLDASGLGAVGLSTAQKKTGEAEEVEAGDVIIENRVFPEKRVHFCVESGEAAQIHLIVANDAHQWPGGTSAQIIEIKLGNERGSDIVVAMPAEARRIEDVTFELDQAHRTEAQLPDSAGRMEEIKMRGEPRNGDRPGHGETTFKQRPVEGFSVEGDENGTFGDAGGQFVKQGMLLGKVTHEELFDLKAASIPPGETHEKSIGAGAAGEAGGFGVEKQPLRGIGESSASTARESFIARMGKKRERSGQGFDKFRGGEPVAKG